MKISQKLRTLATYLLGPLFKITTAVVVILVIILAFFIFINPKYKEARSIGVLDLEAKKKELAAKSNELSELKELENDYQGLNQAQLKEVEKILPRGVDFANLVGQIEALARDSNLTLDNISVTEGGVWGQTGESPADETETSSKKTTGASSDIYLLNVSVNFSGGGTYEHFKLFLDNLENNLRILDLSSVSFTPDTQSYTLNLKTYYLK